jgi:5-methylcytosine-specific restriction endonuclease McrA
VNPTSTALALMAERNIHTCQVEGCSNPGEEAHHMLYRKKKGVTELNQYENLALVCRECHHITGKAKTLKARMDYWAWACDYYGHDEMVAWHEDLPLVIKEKYYR